MSAEQSKVETALRQALRNYPAVGANEPNANILRIEERPTFGVGSVRMPLNQLVEIREGKPKYDPPITSTVRFVELCRDFLIPVMEEKQVRVNDETITIKQAAKDETGKFKHDRQERCFNRLIPEPVLACSARLADHIESLTPEPERTATTRLQSQVEGFLACTDESENTFIASAVLEAPRNEVKQIVSQIEIPFDVKVPAAGLTEEEAINLLERQKKRAAERAARGEPVIRRAIDPSTGRTVDQWGMPSYIIPAEAKAANRERYCPEFNQTVGCQPQIPTPEAASEEEAIRISPEEAELIAARQNAAQLPELPPLVTRPARTALPAVETLSPEAQRIFAELRRRIPTE